MNYFSTPLPSSGRQPLGTAWRWLVMLLAALMVLPAWSQTVVSFEGTTTTTSTFLIGAVNARRSQSLYTPSRFPTAPVGTITKVAFKRSTTAAGTNWNGLRFRMAQNNLTAHNGTSYIESSAFTTVMTIPGTYSIPAGVANDWIEFTLDNPYLYIPSQTLALEVEWLGPGTSFSWVCNSSQTGSRLIDDAGGTAYSTATTGTTNANLPHMRLTINPITVPDAGLSAISLSPSFSTYCSATNATPSVTVNNVTAGTVTSLRLEWFKNNISQGTQDYTGLNITPSQSGTVSFTSQSFPFTGSTETLTQWRAEVVQVNGGPDPVAINNVSPTVTTRSSIPGGTYIVGAGGQWATPVEAINALNNRGICGNVTLRVRGGNYTGQAVLGPVPGNGPTGTITIENENASPVTWSFDANTDATANYLLQINGTDFVTIKNLTLSRANAVGTPTQSRIIDFSNGADYFTIEGCTLNGYDYITGATTTAFASIFSNTTVDLEPTIKNCTFNGNGTGIYLVATTTGPAEGGYIENNTISTFADGIWLAANGQGVGAIISGNTITRSQPTLAGAFTGIELNTCRSGTQVFNNRVVAQSSSTSAVYPFYITGGLATSTDPINVYNNYFSGTSTGTGTTYGVYVLGQTENCNIYHNNVYASSGTTSVTSLAGINFAPTTSTSATNNVRNNNFVIEGTVGYPWYTATEANVTTRLLNGSHNNLWRIGGSSIGRIGTTAQTTLTALNTASGNKMPNLISADPLYTSSQNLLAASPSLSGAGTPIALVTTDILNAARSNPPTIGANEVTVSINNAQLNAITLNSGNFCNATSVTPTFFVANSGTNVANSITISWRLVTNGVAGSENTYTATGLSLAAGGNTSFALPTPFTAQPGSYYQIRAIITQVNGATDTDPLGNENRSVTIGSNWSGNYTVGSTPGPRNFVSVVAFADSLVARGICGPIVATVAAGTYTGAVLFPSVPGASQTNNVVIQGATTNAANVIITAPAGATAAVTNFAVRAFGVEYYTFKNLTISRTEVSGQTGGNAMVVDGGSHDLLFDNVRFISFASTATTASSTHNAFASLNTSSLGDYNITIKNCYFEGGVANLYMAGTTSNRDRDWLIENCTFRMRLTGIYGTTTSNITVRGCDIRELNSALTNTSYGMDFNTNTLGGLVENNTIVLKDGGTTYGISVTDAAGTATNPFVVRNNFISMSGTGTHYGYYISLASNYNWLYHNTIITDGPASVSAFYCVSSTATNLDVRNNIFASLNPLSTGGHGFYTTQAGFDDGDSFTRNVIYTAAPSRYAHLGSARNTFNDFLSAGGSKVAGTQNVDPGFASIDSYGWSLQTLNGKADASVGVTTDITGATRQSPPDPGAWEYFPPVIVNEAELVSVDNGISSVCGTGTASPSFVVKNNGTNAITSLVINWALVTNTVEGSNVQSTVTGLNIPQFGTATVNVPQTWSYIGGNYYQIRATIGQVNGNTDPNLTNNGGRSVTVAGGLQGAAYTINPALSQTLTNYTSINRFVDTLSAKGLCANVTVTLAAGNYDQQLILTAIPNSSSSAVLTIQGPTADPTAAVLRWPAGATTTDNYVLNLNGASNIVLKNFTIQRTAQAANVNSNVLVLSNGTSDVVVDNMRLITIPSIATSGAANLSVVSSSALSQENNITIQNSYIEGGHAGIYMPGISTSSRDANISVLNNTVRSGYYSIWTNFTNVVNISGNDIRELNSTLNIVRYGIYVQNNDGGGLVSKNKVVLNSGSSTNYGIYLNIANGTATNPTVVTNNFSYLTGTGTQYAGYVAGASNYAQFRHNTFIATSSGTAYGFYGLSTTANFLTAVNNIGASMNAASGTGHGMYFSTAMASTGEDLRSNVIYTASPTRFSFLGTAQNTLADFLTTGGTKVTGTISVDPQFVTAGSYEFTNAAINGIGINAGVTDDIDGNPRGTTPDPGAYEYVPVANDGALVALASTNDCNVDRTIRVRLQNPGSNPITSATVTWSIQGVAQTPAVLTGLNVPVGGEQVITLGNFNFIAGSTYTIDATLTQVNGTTDPRAFNNTMPQGSVSPQASSAISLPLSIDFNALALGTGVPANWNINPATDGTAYRWTVAAGANGSTISGPGTDRFGSATGRYLYVVAGASGAAAGNSATLTSDCINLGTVTNPLIKFWYHRYGSGSPFFFVDVYNNGVWTEGVFTFSGQDPDQTSASSAWKQALIPLTNISGNQLRIRLRAIRTSSTAGEMAIDDLEIVDGSAIDLSVTGVNRVSTGCSSANDVFSVTVSNRGATTYNFVTRPVTFRLNVTGAATGETGVVWQTGSINAGETVTLNVFNNVNTLPQGNLSYTATASVANDIDLSNNTSPVFNYASPVIYDQPWSNFGRFTGSNLATIWPGASEAQGETVPAGTTSGWLQSAVLGGDTTIKINLFNASKRDWILLPLTRATSASKLKFRIAMTDFGNANVNENGGMPGTDDFVAVKVSNDCGLTWTDLLVIDGAWVTANGLTNSLMDRTIDLSAFAGQVIRVAFFASEGTINDAPDYDMHLDDIAITNDEYISWNGRISNSVVNKYNWTPSVVPTNAWKLRFTSLGTQPVVSGNLTLGTTAFAIGSRMTFTGTPTITVLGDIVGGGAGSTLTGAFNLVLAGSSPQSIGGIGRENQALNNLTVNNSTGVTLTSELFMNGALTLQSGVFNLANNQLVLRRQSATQSAFLAPVTGGSLANASNFTYQTILPNPGPLRGGWYFLGTSVTGKTVSQWNNRQTYAPTTFDGNPLSPSQLYLYDANASVNNGWVKPSSASQALTAGQGVRFYYQHPLWSVHAGRNNISGAPHIGNYDFSSQLSVCTGGGCVFEPNNGWNLLANPYAADIDWDSPNWTKAPEVSAEIKVWNPVLRTYASYVGGVGTNGGAGKLVPGQGFFVRLTGAPSSSPALRVQETAKTTGASALRGAAITQVMRIAIKDAADNQDEAVVRLLPGATLGYDRQTDASFMEGQFVNVYSHAGTERMSINAVDMPTASTVVPLGVRTTQAGLHTFTFTGLADVTSDYDLYLNDAFTGARTPLTDGQTIQFTVTAAAASTGEGRFSLVMQPRVTSLGGSVGMKSSMTAFPNPSTNGQASLIINNVAAGNAVLLVTDAAGRVVATQQVSLQGVAQQTVALENKLAAGVYKLSLRTAAGHLNHKLVVQP